MSEKGTEIFERLSERMKEMEERMKESVGRIRVSPSYVRTNVIASRIGDEDLQVIDVLIEAGLFSTRSEAVAFLVSEGIKARKNDIEKVSSELEKIRRIRREAEEHIAKLKKDVGIGATEALKEPLQHKKLCPKCGKDLANLPEDITICPYCGFKI